MKNEVAATRFEGPSAFVQLMHHLKIPVGQRLKIRIESRHLRNKILVIESVVVRNHVPKDSGKSTEHSVFHVADLFRSKSGQPLRIRFVWPPEYADPHGKHLYPLEAIEVQES
ncbi:MAG: hypothetical protein A2359_03515 [Candidatus Moranbacteria bacterium RIFOXYB1_FULL_43_19]|nr:MAG: hypothetical protein A2359_03515 [Candidatus Moranbacteria bacterium RIFOXYB1_FULL_43_19]OGI32523.1 MAG: hypothetical protein A2420_03020 [Candidatus Moranbacteria bacterium RIFOXYC1_FULL_44_13]OGI38144.1 MAG: hypothetical protein A2612_01305 [Candidatus Moranbacteria bacterium RIFOXYD1_FULL_44_12]